ncbi:class I SAM-dependent methyltransferase [Candidatus Solirubrobacter pratensis]|uniref:class I SAM-dependent methyltransferase n=1 Tax=Candidatus Solirubrobacter pratensis TaxID=1298857 RepID=UPI000425A4D7|nr:class I SAM-dependent methyltransferase [Candidatus Solirubrobacter pratensis]
MNPQVIWHDVECGRYEADLPLWEELARSAPEGVLDVGAGTGRVALPLARAGHAVTALDLDAGLLAELSSRAEAEGLRIPAVVADAADFRLDTPVSLIIVPMQTIQLLPERGGFFASARRALVPGGRVAIAIATGLEAFDGGAALPYPDLGEAGGYRFISQPVAIRLLDDGVRIERVRQLVSPDGTRENTEDAVHLATVSPGELVEEAAGHGLEAEELRHIPETPEHVGSEVVILRG